VTRDKGAFLLAYDVGTSSLKGVVYACDGTILASAASRYENSFPQKDWAEADPSSWWQALLEVSATLKEELPSFGSVEVLSFTGQMHTAVLLDDGGKPLPPTILWLDRRAVHETEELARVFHLPPYHLNSTYTLPKLYWLAKNMPDMVPRIRHILLAKDYMRYLLTGTFFTDFTDAGGAALLDWQNMDWARERLEYIGMPPHILPPIKHASDFAATTLLPDVASQLGLPQGVRVMIGAGDSLALRIRSPPRHGRADRARRDESGHRSVQKGERHAAAPSRNPGDTYQFRGRSGRARAGMPADDAT